MMVEDSSMRFILILPSIHFVMKLEKEALARNISFELIPTPKQISSDCGMAVEFSRDNLAQILSLMKEKGLPEGKIFYRSDSEWSVLKPV
jgi:hypothetical protein